MLVCSAARMSEEETERAFAQPFILPGGACGVMVIVVGNGHDDTSSNPGRD